MPILWRYLLGQYLKVLILCTCAFVGVLMVTRMDEIARIAAMGGQASYIFYFAALQVPYILPIALPISCLISSILLFQRLSHSHELTAMRASGLSLRAVVAPILMMGAFLSLLNFYIVSEVATESHLRTRRLQEEIKTVNPLLLLQNHTLLQMQGMFVKVLGGVTPGESAEDIFFAFHHPGHNRLYLGVSKAFVSDASTIRCDQLSMVSSLDPHNRNAFDHLVIENVVSSETPMDEFTRLMKKGGWRLSSDHLRLSLLRTRILDNRRELRRLHRLPSADPHRIVELTHLLHHSYSDYLRRMSVGLAIFSFTIMGAAFGMDIGRTRSYRGVVKVILLAAFYLFTFFAGKSCQEHFWIAAFMYTIPHMIMITLSVRALKATNRGIE
jgi:lipopolysaccharide export system permease protein